MREQYFSYSRCGSSYNLQGSDQGLVRYDPGGACKGPWRHRGGMRMRGHGECAQRECAQRELACASEAGGQRNGRRARFEAEPEGNRPPA